jgi:hypothetical protein
MLVVEIRASDSGSMTSMKCIHDEYNSDIVLKTTVNSKQ